MRVAVGLLHEPCLHQIVGLVASQDRVRRWCSLIEARLLAVLVSLVPGLPH